MNLNDFYPHTLIGKLTVFLKLQEFNFRFKKTVTVHDRGQFHFRRVVFSSQFKSCEGNILAKTTSLRISRLSNSSLSLGVPVPRATQCMQEV